ncbi:hypothetical protein Glove_120g209 [Diversispora epigaea]|uniref:DUF5615 domain-containing protein n=1 Tax=Diversispora epigaea TaxID=1348612 RepID=A0A397IZF1_9GLOM|nr:hypothetical protein Glove_120g209 [Diversispora epigaea]
MTMIVREDPIISSRSRSSSKNGRKMGSDPVIVGSRPSRDDEIWDQAKKDGFTVIVHDRNFVNKDTTLVLYLKDPVGLNLEKKLVLQVTDGEMIKKMEG